MTSAPISMFWTFIVSVTSLFSGCLIASQPAEAQSQGNNAVYNSNAICSSY